MDEFCERLLGAEITDADLGEHQATNQLVEECRRDFDTIPAPVFDFDEILRNWEIQSSLSDAAPQELDVGDEMWDAEDELDDDIFSGLDQRLDKVDDNLEGGGIDIIRKSLRENFTVAHLIKWYRSKEKKFHPEVKEKKFHPEVLEAVRAGITYMICHKCVELFSNGLHENEQKSIMREAAKVKKSWGAYLFEGVMKKIGFI